MARLNIPCDQGISCPGPRGLEDDFPVQNWTSEQPDRKLFIGQNWGYDTEEPPLGTNWTHAWCYGVCFSSVSQEEADLCAAANQYLCIKKPPGDPTGGDGGGGDPTYPVIPQVPPPGTPPGYERRVFGNEPTTCKAGCPDGTEQTYTVKEGTFFSSSQSQANEMATSYCRKFLDENVICLGDIFDYVCSGQGYTEALIELTSGPNPPYTFSYTGSIPAGMALTPEVDGMFLSGSPTTPGNYTFTVKATNSKGVSKSKDYTVSIFGISNLESMPEAHANVPYSFQLMVDGNLGAVTFSLAGGTTLPAGLTLSPAGLISGTPTGFAESRHVIFSVEDAL